MKQSLALSSLLLTAGLVSTTAQSAEFASADCVTGLNEIGLISVSNISGNPQDAQAHPATYQRNPPVARSNSASCTRSDNSIPPRVSSIIWHQAWATGGDACRNISIPHPNRKIC